MKGTDLVKIEMLDTCVIEPGVIGKKGKALEVSEARAAYLVGIKKAKIAANADPKRDENPRR